MSQRDRWTEQRISTLRQMWNAGKFAREIATTLGSDFTRNMVIGKAYRLGLTHPKSR